MAGLIDIKVKDRDMRKLNRQLKRFPTKVPLIMSRSINKAMTSAKTQIAREISSEVKVKVTTVKKSIKIRRANFKSLFSTALLSARRIPLIEFAAKHSPKRGVTYRITKTGKRERIPRAFIATMKSGHTGVFKRKSRTKGSDRLVKRSPISELRGPSLQKVFRQAPAKVAAVATQAAKNLEKFIAAQVKLLTRK